MQNQLMKFGMPTLVELPSLEDHFVLAQKLGLDFIEVNMTYPQNQSERLQVDKIACLIAKYGIELTIHLDENLNVGDFNREIARVYTETVLTAVDLAKKLKIPVLNMHMAESVKISLPDRKLFLFEEYLDDYLHRLFAFRIACEKAICNNPIKICIENLGGFKSFHQKGIDLLLESPVFDLTMDIGHDYITQHADKKFILNRANRLSHFHIHDATEKNCHLALGQGEMDIEKDLELASQHGGCCVIEIKTVAALTESVAWLKEKKWLLNF